MVTNALGESPYNTCLRLQLMSSINNKIKNKNLNTCTAVPSHHRSSVSKWFLQGIYDSWARFDAGKHARNK